MTSCGRHDHNTVEGAQRCRSRRWLKVWERRVRRGEVLLGRPTPVRHHPARKDTSKPIVVWIFSESR